MWKLFKYLGDLGNRYMTLNVHTSMELFIFIIKTILDISKAKFMFFHIQRTDTSIANNIAIKEDYRNLLELSPEWLEEPIA